MIIIMATLSFKLLVFHAILFNLEPNAQCVPLIDLAQNQQLAASTISFFTETTGLNQLKEDMQELVPLRRMRRYAEPETDETEAEEVNEEHLQSNVESSQPEENTDAKEMEENLQPAAEAVEPGENAELISGGSDNPESENVEEETAAETQIVAENTEAQNGDNNESVNSSNVDTPNSLNDGEETLAEPVDNTEPEVVQNTHESKDDGQTNPVPNQLPSEISEQSTTNEEEGGGDEISGLEENDDTIAGEDGNGFDWFSEPEENDDITGKDDGDGFATESPNKIPLKQDVLTTVLEAEVLTDSFDCSGNRGPLTQMATDSKFFVDSLRLHTFLEAREVCSKNNLVIAEVQELGDHWAIEEFMSQRDYHDRFFIGLNDIKMEGVFRHANGKNVTYQNFLPSQPDDFNQTEDCVTITKERRNGPSGAADYDCNSTAHVLCMFRVDGQCYNESKETIENRKLVAERELHLLVNASERAYFVSTYQSTWKEAMKQCDSHQMKLFNMDEIVNRGFFRSMIHWEKKFFRIPMPTVQYWTSGKFKKSHMSAPIIWHTKPELDESEERGIEKHNGSFSFSGLYQWSTKKIVDPGGPHGWRRDLCVAFGFDRSPEETPYLRNTNCDLPAYFICYVEYPDAGESSGEETTTEEEETTTMGPVNPEDMPGPLEPVSPEEVAELEEKFANETEGFNHSCTTSDKDDVLTGRNGIIGSRWRWTKQYGFTVYIDPNYSSNDRKRINIALDNLRKVVCIPFYLFRRNQRPYGDYVHVQNLGNGRCHSAIGRQGGGQTMSLGRGCTEVGTIMHEMMHALGCYHEQSRPDRDNYIIIYWNNIIPHLRSQFQKAGGTSSWGIPYNTRSVMHYPADAFSSNGRIVIAAKNGGRVGGNVLTREDKQLLRKMYNCDSG